MPPAERGLLDTILDFADGTMDAAAKVTGQGPRVVEVKAGGQRSAPAPRRAPARSSFQIVEALDDSGDGRDPVAVWIVTDGTASATCTTPELAARILGALS